MHPRPAAVLAGLALAIGASLYFSLGGAIADPPREPASEIVPDRAHAARSDTEIVGVARQAPRRDPVEDAAPEDCLTFHVVIVRDRLGNRLPDVPCALFILDEEQDKAFLDVAPLDETSEIFLASDDASLVSDATGAIPLKQLNEWLPQDAEDRNDPDGPTAAVLATTLPMEHQAFVRIPLDGCAPREHALRLPPLAELELGFALADGSPVVPAVRSEVSIEAPMRHGRLELHAKRSVQCTKAHGAERSAPPVRIGLHVALRHSIEVVDQGIELTRTLRALTRSGRARRRVRLPHEFSALHIPLRVAPGAPMPESVQIDADLRGTPSLADVLQPVDGTLHAILRVPRATARFAARLWDEARPETSAVLEERLVHAGRTHVLPPVTLGDTGRVARGRCVDERGRGVAGAQVRARRVWSRRDRQRYRYLPRLKTRSDAQGRFALPLPGGDAHITLVAERAGHGKATHDLAADREAVLVLPRRVAVRIRVTGLPSACAKLRVACEERGRRRRRESGRSVECAVAVEQGLARAELQVVPGAARITCDAGAFFGSWDVEREIGARSEVTLRAPPLREYRFEFGGEAPVALELPERRSTTRESSPGVRFERGAITNWRFETEYEFEFRRAGHAQLRRTWRPGTHALRFEPLPSSGDK